MFLEVLWYKNSAESDSFSDFTQPFKQHTIQSKQMKRNTSESPKGDLKCSIKTVTGYTETGLSKQGYSH